MWENDSAQVFKNMQNIKKHFKKYGLTYCGNL